MILTILSIIVLVFSAIIHEYAHGWMAKRLGDDTAEREGRLTLNPLKHLDPVGSVILPLLLVLTKASFFLLGLNQCHIIQIIYETIDMGI